MRLMLKLARLSKPKPIGMTEKEEYQMGRCKMLGAVILSFCLMVTSVCFMPRTVQAKEITSVRQVKKLAKKQVKGAKIVKVDMDYESGKLVFEAELRKGKKEYNLTYRASDSKLISYEWEIESWHISNGRGNIISEGKARKLAKKQVKNASITSIVRKRSDGIDIYKVKMKTSKKKYELKLHARTGKVLEYEWKLVTKKDNNKGYIGEEKAKAIALNKVGSGTVVKVEFDNDDGTPVYDVEIVKGELEYEVKIHAKTGKILKFEMESIYD